MKESETKNYMELQELKERVRQSIMEFGEIRVTRGAFGDTAASVGIVEYIDPTDVGTFTKYFGCKYLFRGYPDLDLTEQLHLGKAFLSRIPREILWRSWAFRLVIILMALFATRRFSRYVWLYSQAVQYQLKMLNESTAFLRSYRFTPFVNELRRAFHESLKKNGCKELIGGNNGGLLEALANIAEFFFLFIEFDTAYHLPLHDILENLDKSGRPRDIVKRLISLYIERSGNIHPQNNRKFVRAGKMLGTLLFIPKLKKVFRDFISELDVAKFERDENDWYYCLDRLYDHRGLALETRKEMKRKMDETADNFDLWAVYLADGAKGDINFTDWLLC